MAEAEWYVVQTLGGRERKDAEKVRNDVAGEGDEVFIIENEKEFRINGEWVPVLRPLFPAYIFVETADIEGFAQRLYRKCRSLRLLTMDGKPEPIRKNEREYLMDIGGESHIVRYSEGIQIGDKVEIISGSFKGYKGDIRKHDRHKRWAKICLQLMGQDVEVEIGLGIVKVLPEPVVTAS